MTDLTRHWFTAILRAGITGFSTAISVSLSQIVVTDHVGWRVIGISSLVTAGIRMAEFLRRHPLPGVDIADEMGARTLEISKPTLMVPKEGTKD